MHKQSFESVKNKSETVAGILQGVIQSQYKCGRAPFVGNLLESVLAFSDLKYIIVSRNGKIFLESGEKERFPNNGAQEGFELLGNNFYFWRYIDKSVVTSMSPDCMEQAFDPHKLNKDLKKNRKNGIKPSDGVFMGIVMQDQEYFAMIKKCDFEMLVNLIIGIAFILIFSSGWIYFIRHSELKNELEQIRKKNEFLSELSFAASGLAHETKNPLGIIRGLAQQIVMEQQRDALSVKTTAEKIVDEIDVITERLGDFMNYARPGDLKKEPVKIKALAEEIVSLMKYDFDKAQISIETRLDDVTVESDREAFTQIIVNLLQNSIKASSIGGYVYLNLVAKNNFAEMVIADNGTGISPDIISDVFKPYVRGTNSGHGIGLAIVKKLADASDWQVSVQSEEGRGTTMKISNIRVL